MRRILIDGTMASGGGGFTYLANIVPELSAAAPDDRFRLLVRSERLEQVLPELPNVEVLRLPPVGLAGRLRFTHLEAPRMAARWGADLHFSAGETAPLRAPCPTIASFRNPNVFTDLPLGWPLAQRLRLRTLRLLAGLSARICDRILFVSEDSARWMGDALGLPGHRRAVVHHGIDLRSWAPAETPVRERPFILSVSSIYRYKNFLNLIRAYASLAARREELPDLVIVGDDQDPDYARAMRAAVAESGCAERIRLVGEVPYHEVRSYYRQARLFVFPSYLETFGHPLLEAMASEVPLVAADIPVFREIAGDAAFYADPHDPDALAHCMEEALFRLEADETLVKRGAERVRRFTWGRSAARLLGLFDEVLAPVVQPAPAPALLRG